MHSANRSLDESQQTDSGPTTGQDYDRESSVPGHTSQVTSADAQTEPERDKCSAAIGHRIPRECSVLAEECRGVGAIAVAAAAIVKRDTHKNNASQLNQEMNVL